MRPSAPVTPGLVVVDKPAGITSHDVVARVRRLAGTRKVGHAGTLDPMATGVLVLGVDRATRLLGHLMLTEKAYAATVRVRAAVPLRFASKFIRDARNLAEYEQKVTGCSTTPGGFTIWGSCVAPSRRL